MEKDPPNDIAIVVNPAWVSCFHRNGLEAFKIFRNLIFIIMKLYFNHEWHEFCRLGIRQEQPEIPIMHQPCFPRRQSGFTLIEIAIVLVIIGLLLGGILKGQELITQGRIRNVGNDFQSVTAAINLYQDRYRALPGDDAGAATRWTTTTAGDGDGVFDGAYNEACTSTSTTEPCLFWHHLRLAGLVSGATTDRTQAVNASQGRTGVQNGGLGLVGPIVCSNNLPAKIAQAIDAQFDDGIATTGTMRGETITALTTALTATTPTANYVDNGTNIYVVCKNP